MYDCVIWSLSLSDSCDFMHCSLLGSSARGFSKQEYCGEMPFPSPRDRPNLGIKSRPPALQADSCKINNTKKTILEVKICLTS